MSALDPEVVKLIQKMTLAEAAIKRIPKAQHAKSCPIENADDTALTGPSCNCGADAMNAALKEALAQLKLNPA